MRGAGSKADEGVVEPTSGRPNERNEADGPQSASAAERVCEIGQHLCRVERMGSAPICGGSSAAWLSGMSRRRSRAPDPPAPPYSPAAVAKLPPPLPL